MISLGFTIYTTTCKGHISALFSVFFFLVRVCCTFITWTVVVYVCMRLCVKCGIIRFSLSRLLLYSIAATRDKLQHTFGS